MRARIVFDPFRQRPAELFFPEAARRGLSVVVRMSLTPVLFADAAAESGSLSHETHGTLRDISDPVHLRW